MRMLRGASAAIVALLAIASPVAAETSIEEATAAIDASDYLKARGLLTRAVAEGSHGPSDLAEIYRLSGIVAGALGDADAATEAFQRCLALDPRCALPVGTSPKITRPFTAAQELFETRAPIQIKSETAAAPPSVTVVIASDPLAMIAKVRVIAVVDGKPEQTLDGDGKDRIKIDLPEGARLDLRIAALDTHGNRVAEIGSRDVPIVIVGTTKAKPKVVVGPVPDVKPPPAAPYRARPLYLRWWLWGGTAIVFGGLGTYFGIDAMRAKNDLDALNANSSNHTFDEAKRIESGARRSVLFTNISYAAAGVFAIGAAVLYLTAPERPAAVTADDRTAIAPVIVEGGAGVAVGGRF